MDLPIVVGVVVFIAVTGSLAALWWWKLADRWAKEEERRFNRKGRSGPHEVTIERDRGPGGSAHGGAGGAGGSA